MPRGNRTRSPSTSAPASRKSSIASGASRKSIPTCSRIVSAFSSRSDEALLGEHLERRERAGQERHALDDGVQSRCLAGGAPAGSSRPSGSRSCRLPLSSAAAGRSARWTRCAGAGSSTWPARRGYGSTSWGIAIALTKCSWKRGSTAVSIFSTLRTTSSISAREARFSKRDARARAGGVPGGRDPFGIAVGNETEDERVDGVDVGAERAGEPDAIDALDPVSLHQERAAGVQRGLGELDLADVVLRDDELRLAGPEDVGERAAVGDDPLRAVRRARRRSCRRS